MPKTKGYDDRKKILNELFRSRVYSLNELIRKVSERLGVGVSKKTIQDMLMYMRAEGAPITNIRGQGYVYEPRNYNIYDIKIDPASTERIKFAAALLKQIPGMDLHEDLKEVFDILEMRSKSDVDADEHIVQFDTKPNYEGAKHINEIIESIKGKTVISFAYQPFTHYKPYNVILHPSLLKQYNNRWFVIGFNENNKRIEQFGLERIKGKMKIVALEYNLPADFDATTYHRDIIGVTVPEGAKTEKIVLRFSKLRAFYVTTNKLHESQKLIKTTKSHLTFEYQLIPNKELETLILSYGADVKVVQPKTLRNSIINSLKDCSKLYF